MVAGLFSLALALFDEVSQEIPGLNRSFDPFDLVADAGGIVDALAWCVALGPPRRGPAWWLEAYRRRAAGYRLLLASPGNWMHLGIAGVLGAMIGGVLLAIAGRNPVVGPITMTVVGAQTGLVAGVVGALEIGRRHAAKRIEDEQRCLGCLVAGVGAGTRCGCGVLARPVDLERRVAPRRLLLPTAITLLLAAGVLVAGYLGMQALRFSMVRPWPVFSWYCPATQLAHAAALVRPVCVWYLPAAQLLHLVRPVCSWYVPAAQLLHLVCSWYLPAAQQRINSSVSV